MGTLVSEEIYEKYLTGSANKLITLRARMLHDFNNDVFSI